MEKKKRKKKEKLNKGKKENIYHFKERNYRKNTKKYNQRKKIVVKEEVENCLFSTHAQNNVRRKHQFEKDQRTPKAHNNEMLMNNKSACQWSNEKRKGVKDVPRLEVPTSKEACNKEALMSANKQGRM